MTIEEIKEALNEILIELNEHEAKGEKLGLAWSFVFNAVKELKEVQEIKTVDAADYIERLERERDFLKDRAKRKYDD